MTKPRMLFSSSSSPSPSCKLGIVDESQVIAKLKPKIRVIHVDAPKIIQTDAANFRDLVQRLTGKPSSAGDDIGGGTMEKEEEQQQHFLGLRNGKKKKKRIKNEEDEEDHNDDEISTRSKSNKERFNGFFDHHHHGFSAELDGFMEQLSTMN